MSLLKANQPSSWEMAYCWDWHQDCPLAKTHWTETKNTHPSLYVADNSSWVASSGLDSFDLSAYIFSVWLGDYSSLYCIYLCTCLLEYIRQSVTSCKIIIPVCHRWQLYPFCHTDAGIQAGCSVGVTLWSEAVFLTPAGGEWKILRSDKSHFCHTHL